VRPRIAVLLLLVLLGSTRAALPGRLVGGRDDAPARPPAAHNIADPGMPERTRGGEPSPYRFDLRANALVRIFFPKTVSPSGYSKAYLDRARSMAFASRDELLEYHSTSVNAGATVPVVPYEHAAEATESFWRSAHPHDGRSQKLFEQVPTFEALARSLARDGTRPTDVLEKALWQRDLVCSLQAIHHCRSMDEDTRAPAAWRGAEHALLDCLKQVLLTPAEYRALCEYVPASATSSRFTHTCRCALSDNYMPPIVFGPSAGWHELPSDEDPGLHYQAYGGRDFTRVFMRVPGMDEKAFFDYWRKVTRRFGMGVTVSAAVPRLPAGTETVLLRTFGVFLDDGSFADSGIPEEVLVRIFKYRDATLDSQTSDGVGTLHYQYKMRRQRLLSEPDTLGLVRIHDADGQFYGFFAEVPEVNSTEHLTTMRANCISCHSEVLYGASTIFSLCRHRPATPRPARFEGGSLERIGLDRWRVKQEPLQAIQDDLMSRLRHASAR
jgi:hypothetical protein